ncbi:MAG: chromosomal replication initiator protein DnaA [Bacteroidales bacterium]|jgi:chromosomal replication initiator protein|nr:chromosomal replication initiator protein DnaA [Bacteroidales bacterium]
MDKDVTQVWQDCLEIIKDNLAHEHLYQTWFEPIKPVTLEGNVLTLQVPSHFFYEYLEEHYLELLIKTLRREIGPNACLQYTILVDTSIKDNPFSTLVPSTSGKITKDNKPQNAPLDISISNHNGFPNPFTIPGIQKITIPSNLNENYSFENFVEGECNRLVRSAGYAIAKNPGRTSFNPLFIYSAVGLGKTHIANAIGLETKKNFPNCTVLYISAEQFMQQFTDAVANKDVNQFLLFYQMVDVLIIDDIQFFIGKKGTEDIFFNVFNSLHGQRKQIIVTSDRSPAELNLTDRVVSRLKWGLNAELSVPDVETRKAIIKQMIKQDGVEMTEDVIEYLAYNVNTNLRDLRGTLISLIAQSSFNHKDITLELTSHIIDSIVKSVKQEMTIEYIQRVVCDYFHVDVNKILTSSRKGDIAQARQIAMYFSRKLTKHSLSTIGTKCGNKDHSTVLHACKQVDNHYSADRKYKTYIDEIEQKLSKV